MMQVKFNLQKLDTFLSQEPSFLHDGFLYLGVNSLANLCIKHKIAIFHTFLFHCIGPAKHD